MKNVKDCLYAGVEYFGSSSVNTPEFNSFFIKFKKEFTKELKKLNATEIQFSKGHFYLSGFFKVNEQYYYFSLSDVRNSFGYPSNLLIRTAKNNKDYTGSSNNFVKVETDMYEKIARTFSINF